MDAKQRSIKQNALYWKWMQEISEQAKTEDKQKLDKDEWHYLCALRFLGFKDLTVCGNNYKIPNTSTRKLSVKKFTDYLCEIEAEFTTRNVKLTFPDYYDEAMGNN